MFDARERARAFTTRRRALPTPRARRAHTKKTLDARKRLDAST